jgi:hypothetical protein
LGLRVGAALAALAGVEAKAGMAPVEKSTEMAKHAMVFKECMCSGSGARLERIMKWSWGKRIAIEVNILQKTERSNKTLRFIRIIKGELNAKKGVSFKATVLTAVSERSAINGP